MMSPKMNWREYDRWYPSDGFTLGLERLRMFQPSQDAVLWILAHSRHQITSDLCLESPFRPVPKISIGVSYLQERHR